MNNVVVLMVSDWIMYLSQKIKHILQAKTIPLYNTFTQSAIRFKKDSDKWNWYDDTKKIKNNTTAFGQDMNQKLQKQQTIILDSVNESSNNTKTWIVNLKYNKQPSSYKLQ